MAEIDTELDGLTVAEALAQTSDDGLPEQIVDIEEVETDEPLDPMDEVRGELGIGEGVDPLSALLDAPLEPPTDTVPLKRLGASFTVQAITDDKAYDRIVERCTKFVKNRRGGGRTREVDGRRLGRLTVAEYCINPSFTPKHNLKQYEALVEKYGSKEPEDLVERALLMGEVDLLADKILDLSGFDDEVDTAGN